VECDDLGPIVMWSVRHSLLSHEICTCPRVMWCSHVQFDDMQGVVVCCSVLQCAAGCCGVLQCVAVYPSDFIYREREKERKEKKR